jgi:hypothetical protein
VSSVRDVGRHTIAHDGCRPDRPYPGLGTRHLLSLGESVYSIEGGSRSAGAP